MSLAVASRFAVLPLTAAVLCTPSVSSAFDIPRIEIVKGQTGHEWPFSIDRGELSCFAFGGERHVFFSEILSPEEQGTFGNMKLPRMVVVATNPMAYFATFEHRELYLAWESLETLVLRLAPYERMGRDLCREAKKSGAGNEP
jgi:hypothetical protein